MIDNDNQATGYCFQYSLLKLECKHKEKYTCGESTSFPISAKNSSSQNKKLPDQFLHRNYSLLYKEGLCESDCKPSIHIKRTHRGWQYSQVSLKLANVCNDTLQSDNEVLINYKNTKIATLSKNVLDENELWQLIMEYVLF